MKIIIGDQQQLENKINLVLNADNATGCPIFVTQINGLETAPYRNGEGNWSGYDGGYMSTQFYGGRVITISGAYIDYNANCNFGAQESCEYMDSVVRYYIRSHLPIRTLLPVRFFMGNGLVFYTEAYCTDLKMDYTQHNQGNFQITLYCPEPALYRLLDGELTSLWSDGEIEKLGVAGYPTNLEPYVDEDTNEFHQGSLMAKRESPEESRKEYPIGQYWNAGGRGLALRYCGNYPYEPIITIKGPVVNPTIYNTTTNEWFGLGSYTNEMATFSVTSAEPNKTASDIAMTNNNYGGIYARQYSSLVAVSNVGVSMVVTPTWTTNSSKTVIQLSSDPVENTFYQGEYTTATLPYFKPSGERFAPGDWCDVTDDGFEWDWVDNEDPNVLGTWVKSPRPIGTTAKTLPFVLAGTGSGYAVGDYCQLVLSGVESSIDEPAIAKITKVTQQGQILNFDILSYGSYSDIYDGDVNIIAITGHGQGAILLGKTVRRTISTSYAVESVTLSSGGHSYEVGTIVALVPPTSDANSVSLAGVEVLQITGQGAITGISIVEEGEYEEDASGTNLEVAGDIFGQGATIDVGMSQNPVTRMWHVTSVAINNPGIGYTAGEHLQISGQESSQFKLAGGQSVVIDCFNKTVTVGGQSRSYYIREGSKWLYLAPSTLNNLVYTSADTEDDVEAAHIEYKLAYSGI